MHALPAESERKSEGIQEIRELFMHGTAPDRASLYDDWPAIWPVAVALSTGLIQRFNDKTWPRRSYRCSKPITRTQPKWPTKH
jgi:hypothetical protein